MGFTANAIARVRADGSDSNGAFFDPSLGTAQLSVTDLACSAGALVVTSLTGTEVIPIATSGYAGISALQAQLILWNLGDLASVVAAHTTDQAIQNFTLIVGAVNLVGPA